jgi:hypothetical protein
VGFEDYAALPISAINAMTFTLRKKGSPQMLTLIAFLLIALGVPYVMMNREDRVLRSVGAQSRFPVNATDNPCNRGFIQQPNLPLWFAHGTAIFPYSPSLHSLLSKTRRSEPDRLTMNGMGSFYGR